MTSQTKIDHVLKAFPLLADHIDMVKFILEIREVFSLEKVPFEVKVGSWSSGSIEHYHKEIRDKAKAERLKKKKPRKQRPLNQPYTRNIGFKL